MRPSGGYWKFVEPVWDEVVLLEDPDEYLATVTRVGRPRALLCAAFLTYGEVCNGGFEQLFSNSSGMLVPEAIECFRALGMPICADVIDQAASLLGKPFPRERGQRQDKLNGLYRAQLDELAKTFYRHMDIENGGWETAADKYAARLQTQ